MDKRGSTSVLIVHKTVDDLLCVTLNNTLLSSIPPTNKAWRPYITMLAEDDQRLAEQLVRALGENVFRKVLGLQPMYDPVLLQMSEEDALPRVVVSGPKCMFV